MTPVRVQRRREKGWRMPENTVYVGRPTLWGNPWSIADVRSTYDDVPRDRLSLAEAAVQLYRRELEHWGLLSDYGWFVSDERYDGTNHAAVNFGAMNMREYAPLSPLRGKNLACWCPLDQPCHADVLLELANR